MSTSSAGVLVEPLIDRETEVLRLVAKGATNKEIAPTKFISEGTVKNHVSSKRSRFGLRETVPRQ